MEIPAASTAKRKPRFTEQEVAVLIDNVEKQNNILSLKFSDSVTSKKKNSTWSTITQKVNACAPCLRTVDEIRKKWEDLKTRTKKKAAELNREDAKTGGGKKIRSELNQQERRIVGLLGEARITGIVDGLDTADPDEPCRPTVDILTENTVPSFDSFDVDTDFDDQYNLDLSFETQAQVDNLPEVFFRSRASTPCSTAVSARSSPELVPIATPSSKTIAAPSSKPIAAPSSKPIATPSSKPIVTPSSKPNHNSTEKSKVTSDIVKIEEDRLDVEKRRLEIEERRYQLEERKIYLLERLLLVQEKRLHLEELKASQGQRSETGHTPETTVNDRTGNIFTNMLQWQ